MNIPEDFREGLEGYLGYLNKMVAEGKELLFFANHLSDVPLLGTEERVTDVAKAYHDAREKLLSYFPGLGE